MHRVADKYGMPDFVLFFDAGNMSEPDVMEIEQAWINKHRGGRYCINTNDSAGGSSETAKLSAHKAGKATYEKGVGLWSMTDEQWQEARRKGQLNSTAKRRAGLLTWFSGCPRKLSMTQVRLARMEYDFGGISMAKLADKYKIGATSMFEILHHRTYKEITCDT